MRRLGALLALFTLVALAGAEAAHAQSRLGGKLGLVWADVDDDIDNVTTDRRTGFIGGIDLVLPLAPSFFVQPELLYVEKGAEARIDGEDVGEFQFTYVEIPVLGRFELSPSDGPILAYVVGGPYLAFMLDCAVEDAAGDDVECGDEAEEVLDFHDFDWGFALGGGLGYDIGRGWIFAEARYDLGLQEVEDDPDPTFEEIDLNNRAFALLVGVSVPLGPKRVR